ncbi:MAG: PIN domain-containing protein [Bacteroidetes bacterium]|nr:PIN domain-containing protein [Bacteroidota bacterium]
MKDNCFWDTNILVYSFLKQTSNLEIKKQIITDNLTSNLIELKIRIFISNQVIGEFVNVFLKKYNVSEQVLQNYLTEIIKAFEIAILRTDDYKYALSLRFKYGISFYDSLIVAKAINSDCSILYSEDLNHNQVFENKLKVINPFA